MRSIHLFNEVGCQLAGLERCCLGMCVSWRDMSNACRNAGLSTVTSGITMTIFGRDERFALTYTTEPGVLAW